MPVTPDPPRDPKDRPPADLPPHALERLRQITARQGSERPFFTSGLGPAATLTAGGCDWRLLGQVIGSSVYQIGGQWRTVNWRDSDRIEARGYELDIVTEGYMNGRRLALQRLQEQAALLGASTVAGVKLTSRRISEEHLVLEVVASGTALREPGVARRVPEVAGNLSVEALYALRQAGYRAVGLVSGDSVYYQPAKTATMQATYGILGGAMQNQELPEFSQAFYDTRERAIGRLNAQARALGADGVLGITPTMVSEVQSGSDGTSGLFGLYLHFTVIGTAVVRESRPAAAAPSPLETVVWLRPPAPAGPPEEP